jgi:predicted deacylase
LIILPAANFPAVKAGRRTSPIDDSGEGNLNRSFPGDPDGFPTAMIAHYIESVLLPMSDYVFDLHSGGSSLELLPCAYMKNSGDDARDRRAIEIMKVFGAPVSYVELDEDDRTMSAAARRCGTIHMGTELGGGGTVSPQALAIGEQGLRRVLRHVGSLKTGEGSEETGETRLVAVGGADYYVYSPDDGLFEPFVDLGEIVEGGQPAGAVHFPETPWREPSIACFGRSGLVICKRVPGRTERGDCLFHLATDYVE